MCLTEVNCVVDGYYLSYFMALSAGQVSNYRDSTNIVNVADDLVMPIESLGNSVMSFWWWKDWTHVILMNVGNLQILGYTLLSLEMLAECGHEYVGDEGVTVNLKHLEIRFGVCLLLQCSNDIRKTDVRSSKYWHTILRLHRGLVII